MKTEMIEDTINQINSLERQLASVRSQMKRLGNDILSKSTSECAMASGEPRNLSKSFESPGDNKMPPNAQASQGYVDSNSLSPEDWRRRAESFEKRSVFLEKRLNETQLNYDKNVMDFEERLRLWRDRAGNFERDTNEHATIAGAMRLKVVDLEDKVKIIRSVKETVESKRKDLSRKLHEAVMVINKFIKADDAEDFEGYEHAVICAKKFIADNIAPRKEENWMDKAVRDVKVQMQKDIDSLKKVSGEDCDCPACTLRKMIKDGLTQGKYKSAGPIVFAGADKIPDNLRVLLEKLLDPSSFKV